ncbi:CRISPR-associated protein Csx3 [Nostoc sp.]|uniref:CRISPR-associated protein Csx3 n=1 Tax=Nostoc sp. TaxID=1180 RepID=UPI002FF2C056
MYKLELIHDLNCQRLEVGFLSDTVATNSELVKFVADQLPRIIENGPMRGRLLKINGSQSIAIAYHIAHKVAHLYGAGDFCL